MKVGFTGTQQGMTGRQLEAVERILLYELANGGEFHHGDCIGSDAEAATFVQKELPDVTIVCHPPEKKAKRAYTDWDLVRPAKPYLKRNHDIVDECEVLIATPKSEQEELRSGTWATVRYAVQKRRRIYYVYPSGSYHEQKAA